MDGRNNERTSERHACDQLWWDADASGPGTSAIHGDSKLRAPCLYLKEIDNYRDQMEQAMRSRTRNRAQPQIKLKPEQITLSDLYGTLTLSQIVALIGLLVAAISGIYALGIFTESKHNEASDILQAKALADEQALSRSLKSDLQVSKAEISSLNGKLLDKNNNLEEITNFVKRLELQARSNEGEIEFLNRFISYIRAPNDASKSTFVDYVCALWKEAQNRRIHFDREPLTSFNLPLDPTLSSEVRNILLTSGISAETMSRAAQPERRVVRVGPFPREELDHDVLSAKSIINKTLKSATLVKIVKFPDGRSFEIPSEIAFIVHTRPSCSPI